MKKKIEFVIITLLLILSVNTNAQDVKSQSEIIANNVKTGKYKVIAGGRGYVNITKISPDKVNPEHFELILRLYPNDENRKTREKKTSFFADNVAFPTNYMRSMYSGGLSNYGTNFPTFVRREIFSSSGFVGGCRIVFVKDYIFLLSYWENKNDYLVSRVLKRSGSKTKKGFSFLKSIFSDSKESDRNFKNKLKNEVLQPYLDLAEKKKKNIIKEWMKDPKKVKILNFSIDTDKKMSEEIARNTTFVLENDLKKPIFLYKGRSNRAQRWSPGAKVRLRSEYYVWYDFDGKRYYYPNQVILLNNPSNKPYRNQWVKMSSIVE